MRADVDPHDLIAVAPTPICRWNLVNHVKQQSPLSHGSGTIVHVSAISEMS